MSTGDYSPRVTATSRDEVGELARAFNRMAGDLASVDRQRRDLVARHSEVGAIVLECTNMPPYAAALREAVGLPVHDIYSMTAWFHAGLRPRAF